MAERTALVVIDVQNWSVNRHTKDVPKKIADHISRKGSKYDYVLFTKSRNSKSFNLYRLMGVHSGTKGPALEMRHEIARFLTKGNVFNKTTYSAFKSKAFSSYLKKNKITKLYLCGINTDKCVLATAFEAFDLGYDVTVLGNLCGSVNGNASHKAALMMDPFRR